MVGNDNWWKSHGIGCQSSEPSGGGGGDFEGSGFGSGVNGGREGGGEQLEEDRSSCLLSYAAVETIHAVVFMLFTVSH